MEDIIDTHINKAVNFNDVLHRFCVGRVTGTDIMELNLSHELTNVDQEPLLLVYIDLRKAYNNLDCGRILKTF